MSKISNMINMLSILLKEKKVKINELAIMLEVTPRQIRRYKDELEYIGIYIDSTPGKSGGYFLDEKAQENLGTKSNQMLLNRLMNGFSLVEIKEIIHELIWLAENHVDLNRWIGQVNISHLKSYLRMLKATETNQKIVIKYHVKNRIIQKRLHPYFFFSKYHILYLCAVDEMNGNWIYLKEENILEVQLIDQFFMRDHQREDNEKQIISMNNGVFKKDQLVEIDIKVHKNVIDILSDIIEGEVVCKEMDDPYYSCQLHAGHFKSIKYKLLSLGSNVKVISPSEYRSEMMYEIQMMQKLYEEKTNE